MKKNIALFSKSFLLQFCLYLFVNGLFILKYLPRVGVSSLLILAIYSVFLIISTLLFFSYHYEISEKTFRIAYWLLLLIMVLIIFGSLIAIDRYSVRVDRWSAVTFFLDNFFQGKYPYAAHTHVSLTNFASPFPVWYMINLPFYIMGDVGLGLIFFLLLTAFLVKYFFTSYRKSFFFLLLLCVSPAYWWEVAVRSDSLSNALLVFAFILWFTKQNYQLSNKFWLSIIVCGLIASTRLSAILPLALFFFRPYVQLSWKQKVIFPLGVLGIVLLAFLPFIFWDTNSWIFFTRNPFMSQTSVGNPFVLLVMMIFGGVAAFYWKNIRKFFSTTSIFIFIFVLSAQISLILTRGIQENIFKDSLYDVSYFTLLLPYCLVFLVDSITLNQNGISNVS